MNEAQSQNIIFFDGVCNLCNGAVNFIIDHDKKNIFKFSSLQSNEAAKILAEFNIASQLDTFIYLRRGEIHMRSSAALYVLYDLGMPWRVLSIFRILPSFLRDPFYKMISKYRYKLFGKKESCLIPTPENKAKFLEY